MNRQLDAQERRQRLLGLGTKGWRDDEKKLPTVVAVSEGEDVRLPGESCRDPHPLDGSFAHGAHHPPAYRRGLGARVVRRPGEESDPQDSTGGRVTERWGDVDLQAPRNVPTLRFAETYDERAS